MPVTSYREQGLPGSPVPIDWPNEREHRRILARALQLLREHQRLHPIEVTSHTAAFTMGDADLLALVNATSAPITVTLPPAGGCEGRVAVVKKTDSTSNAAIVSPITGETIDGQTSYNIAQQYGALSVVSDGTNWHILAAYGLESV